MSKITSLQDFVAQWNAEKHNVTYTLVQGPNTRYPSSIEARFPIQKSIHQSSWFESLKSQIEIRSHYTMYVSTDENLFLRGIMDLKISTKNPQCSAGLVASVLVYLEDKIKIGT